MAQTIDQLRARAKHVRHVLAWNARETRPHMERLLAELEGRSTGNLLAGLDAPSWTTEEIRARLAHLDDTDARCRVELRALERRIGRALTPRRSAPRRRSRVRPSARLARARAKRRATRTSRFAAVSSAGDGDAPPPGEPSELICGGAS